MRCHTKYVNCNGDIKHAHTEHHKSLNGIGKAQSICVCRMVERERMFHLFKWQFTAETVKLQKMSRKEQGLLTSMKLLRLPCAVQTLL